MSILARLRVLSIVAMIVLLALGSLFIATNIRFDAQQKHDFLAEAILLTFFERAAIRDQYFLFHDDHFTAQWQENKKASDRLIAQAMAQFDDDGDLAVLADLRDATNDAEKILLRIINNFAQLKAAPPGNATYEELDKRLSSQMLLTAHIVRNKALILKASTEKKLKQGYRQLFIVGSLLALALSLIMVLALKNVGGVIRRQLLNLNDGAKVIADGNLNYRIARQGPDEFVELADSINVLTDKLVGFTTQLEVELGERKQVEMALRESEETLRQVAHHDPLTQLPNRLLLRDRLQQAIALSHRSNSKLAVCYLDLDGFKAANDALGHKAGDEILIEVARRLNSRVREGDTVARLGGDEFVVVLSALTNEEECMVALGRMLHAVAEPYQVNGVLRAGISASIGVTIFPTDSVDADTLVRHADHAMYAAKQGGKNRVQMFDTKLERRIEARLDMVRRVEAALLGGQLCLYYQPKVDCRRGQVVGVEALIRWQHPILGLLPPESFLPLIEDTEVAISVGKWVFREALRQIESWQREGLSLRISVNAFVRQLFEPDFVRSLKVMLAEFPSVPAQSFQIEIIESASLMELGTTRKIIEECREFGIDFALDDFGMGYSSLAYIRHLPAEEIKIDQSFVRDMLIDSDDETIVKAVIGLSQTFARTIVAEGAETSAHIAYLLALGCDVVQGYALARPMPADHVLDWVSEFRPDPLWHKPALSAVKVVGMALRQS